MLISDKYRELNTQLHATGQFGISGHKWVNVVEWIVNHHQIKQILDYGAGQETLKKNLQHLSSVQITSYDPAIPHLSAPPAPTELVTCTDVLEHIEPEFINNVLDHIASISTKITFLVIPTGPASKTLADGRNAHLNQKPVEWWLPKLLDRFDLISLNNTSGDIVVLLSAKSSDAGVLNNFLRENVDQLFEYSRIQSITFDGIYFNICIKPKSTSKRWLARLISILSLGTKIGIAKRIKSSVPLPKINLITY